MTLRSTLAPDTPTLLGRDGTRVRTHRDESGSDSSDGFQRGFLGDGELVSVVRTPQVGYGRSKTREMDLLLKSGGRDEMSIPLASSLSDSSKGS